MVSIFSKPHWQPCRYTSDLKTDEITNTIQARPGVLSLALVPPPPSARSTKPWSPPRRSRPPSSRSLMTSPSSSPRSLSHFFLAPHNRGFDNACFCNFCMYLESCVLLEFGFISNLCVSPAAQNTCLGCGPSTSVSHSPSS